MTVWKKPFEQPRLTAFDYENLGHSAMADGLHGTAIGMFERAIEKSPEGSYQIESYQRYADRARGLLEKEAAFDEDSVPSFR